MTETTRQLAGEFEQIASDAQTLTFPARASELQEHSIAAIDAFLKRLGEEKAAAAERMEDVEANAILSMELALSAVRAELNMWLGLKGDKAEQAWDDLIEAQTSLRSAIAVRTQIRVQTATLENLQRKYEFIERFIFPPQMFNSIGGLAALRECSICGCDYEDCSHVVGRAYMGRLCCRIVRQFASLDHVAIVEEPADKRCRITHFSEGDKRRNKMTWRLEEPRTGDGTALE